MTDWKSKYEALCDEHEQQVEAWCELKVKYDAQSAENSLKNNVIEAARVVSKWSMLTEGGFVDCNKLEALHIAIAQLDSASTRHADE